MATGAKSGSAPATCPEGNPKVPLRTRQPATIGPATVFYAACVRSSTLGRMPRYSAEQIYGFARQAGFTPDEAATMTAIAQAHAGLAQKYDLYDPAQNARAAFEVSHGGGDVSPWTVTHGGGSARYLMYRGNAEAAALAAGEGRGLGVWTGTPGYGHPLSAGHDGTAQPLMPAAGPGGGTNPALERFLEAARNQVGDRYVFGAEAKLDDPNPTTFDCSELTEWAAHQAGVTIPDGAAGQYRFLRARGLAIPVEQAKNTPGALLFNFDGEPGPTGGEPSVAHVAISLGDGRTVEAMNPSAGVKEAEAGNRFTFAALIPGISDGTAVPVPPTAEEATTPLPALGGPDSDHDGLTDAREQQLGLDPTRADTDGDNLPDGYE